MRTKSAAHVVAEAVCLTVVLVWALSAFPCTNPAYETVGADSGIFLCMGSGIVQGYTPYVEITENKGPLFFLMMAIPQRIVEGTAGVYVLEVLFALGNCALLMLMARWLMGERRNILCVAACIPVLLRVCGQHLHCEEFNFLFMLLGFAVMIHAYTGQTRGAGARPFLLGLATAAIALIKISDIPGLCSDRRNRCGAKRRFPSFVLTVGPMQGQAASPRLRFGCETDTKTGMLG